MAGGWSHWPTSGLDHRLLTDAVLFLANPAALVRFNGRSLGGGVDRLALWNELLLAVFLVPFYRQNRPSASGFDPEAVHGRPGWLDTALNARWSPDAIDKGGPDLQGVDDPI